MVDLTRLNAPEARLTVTGRDTLPSLSDAFASAVGLLPTQAEQAASAKAAATEAAKYEVGRVVEAGLGIAIDETFNALESQQAEKAARAAEADGIPYSPRNMKTLTQAERLGNAVEYARSTKQFGTAQQIRQQVLRQTVVGQNPALAEDILTLTDKASSDTQAILRRDEDAELSRERAEEADMRKRKLDFAFSNNLYYFGMDESSLNHLANRQTAKLAELQLATERAAELKRRKDNGDNIAGAEENELLRSGVGPKLQEALTSDLFAFVRKKPTAEQWESRKALARQVVRDQFGAHPDLLASNLSQLEQNFSDFDGVVAGTKQVEQAKAANDIRGQRAENALRQQPGADLAIAADELFGSIINRVKVSDIAGLVAVVKNASSALAEVGTSGKPIIKPVITVDVNNPPTKELVVRQARLAGQSIVAMASSPAAGPELVELGAQQVLNGLADPTIQKNGTAYSQFVGQLTNPDVSKLFVEGSASRRVLEMRDTYLVKAQRDRAKVAKDYPDLQLSITPTGVLLVQGGGLNQNQKSLLQGELNNQVRAWAHINGHTDYARAEKDLHTNLTGSKE